MKILGIDSSAKSASAAVVEDGKIISSFYINTGLTHSQTLIPMIKDTLDCASVSIDSLDLIAVNKGPGSFTGIRIGVAAVKGIADVTKTPCIGISTLESMAYNLIDFDGIACCTMDARCNQVYAALFDIAQGKITRLIPDCAISIDELREILKKYKKHKFFVGDGAVICYNAIGKDSNNFSIASEALRNQSAVGVCFAASEHDISEFITGAQLIPEYLRLPQAQRELNNKLRKGV